MKKIVCGIAAALVVLSLCACGSQKCNMCGKSCSSSHSYRDGKVVLCGSCYHDCFKEKTEVDADAYFAVEEVENAAEAAE